MEAKQLLIAACGKCHIINISEFSKNRISSNGERKHLDHMLDIWKIVDSHKGGSLNTIFVAANLHRLPSIHADQCNLQFLVTSILKIREQSEIHAASLSIVNKSLIAIHGKNKTTGENSIFDASSIDQQGALSSPSSLPRHPLGDNGEQAPHLHLT